MTQLLKMLRLKVQKSDGGRSILALVSGTVMGQGLAILTAPLLARLYTPEDFGALAVYGSLLAMLAVLSSLRYELSINVAETGEEAANVLALSLLLVAATASSCAVAIHLFGPRIAAATGAPTLATYLWLLPLSGIGIGSYQVFNYWAIRQKEFSRIARTKATQGVSLVATQLTLGAAGVAPLGLFAGDVLSRFTGIISLASAAWRHDSESLRKVSFKGMRRAMVRFKRFPLVSSWSGLLNTLGLQLPIFVLATHYDTQTTGNFSLVQRVFVAPSVLVGQAVGMYYIGQSGRLMRESPSQLMSLFAQTTQRLFLFGGVPLIIAGLAGPWVFPLVFGPAWLDAGRYTQFLGVVFAGQLVVVPLSQTLNLMERQDLQLAWDIGRLILVLVALLVPSRGGWEAIWAVRLYAAAMIVSYGALLALSAAQLRRKVHGHLASNGV